MSTEWEKASDEVIQIAEELIQKYHRRTHLHEARIGFLFRSEAPLSNGRVTLGKASKVDAKWRPLLEEELDFIIWLAADYYLEMSDREKRALIDHELCHCNFYELKPKIMGHDIEEFNAIVARHGLWDERLRAFDQAMKGQLPLFGEEKVGKVSAVTLAGGRSVTIGSETALHAARALHEMGATFGADDELEFE